MVIVTLILGYMNIYLEWVMLGFGLGLCWFCKVEVIGSPPRSVNPLILGYWLGLKSSHDFFFVKQVLRPIRELLVAFQICSALLPP